MKQVKLYDNTHESLTNIVKQRKEKQPHKGWNIQNVVADLIEKAEERECK
tara:strand:- start:1427 stop:1576 length:150 start_codon:yes stop_codon:yes gene_type:complete